MILQIADLLWKEEDVQNPWAPVTDLMPSRGQAVYHLSRTSTSLYKLLSPYVFRCITLRNTGKSGRAVQHLRSTSQNANMKTLRFKCDISEISKFLYGIEGDVLHILECCNSDGVTSLKRVTDSEPVLSYIYSYASS